MKINQATSNKIFVMKLDPGEPGLQNRSLGIKDTIKSITNQEVGNLYGFLREAMVKGQKVLQYKITYAGGLEDGSMPVLRAGRTEVKLEQESNAIGNLVDLVG